MADVVITMKIMPDSPEADLDALQEKVLEKIEAFTTRDDFKAEQVPVAFGLRALQVQFVSAEDKGSTDDLEDDISQLEGVNSVDVTDVRRAIG